MARRTGQVSRERKDKQTIFWARVIAVAMVVILLLSLLVALESALTGRA